MTSETGWPLLWLVAMAAGLAGCGGTPTVQLPNTAPFSGTVTLDGKPLSGASVAFIPGRNVEKGHPAIGRTNSEGKYELSTSVGDKAKAGAMPGDYKVLINLPKTPDGKPVDLLSKIPQPGKESLKPQYSDSQKTKLEATVPAKGGTKDFELKS